MNLGEFTIEDVEIDTDKLRLEDKWILAKLNKTIENMDYNYDKFEFGEAAKAIHSFSWEDFAAWYVEISKIALNSDDEERINQTKSILSYVLLDIMKLLHPFMPFVTEEIYQNIPHIESSIMVSSWPSIIEEFDNDEAINDFEIIQEIVKAIRNVRQEYGVAPSKQININIKTSNDKIKSMLLENSSVLKRFINPENLKISTSITPDNDDVAIVLTNAEIYLPLGSLVDITQEIERLENELSKLKGEIKRCEGMLKNPNFVEKAPAFKVNQEREKLENYKEQYETVEKRIGELKS
jgi:valyl-tRNA synthetase